MPGGSSREVSLDGRAYFAVAKMVGHPFRVRTPGATVNVLGTRFELSTSAEGVNLSVIEGRVALDAFENSVEVGAGEQSGVRHGTALAPRPIDDHAAKTEWLGRFIVFQATPLRDAVLEIERVYGVQVVIADSGLAGTTVSASFTDRPADAIVDVLCAVVNARCTTLNGVVTMAR